LDLIAQRGGNCWSWILSHYWIEYNLEPFWAWDSCHESLCCRAPFLVTGENCGFVYNPTPFLALWICRYPPWAELSRASFRICKVLPFLKPKTQT
jgi:hypothetical protein